MQYSLGNMLKGGGALNPDGLALDLAFALDKTLSARRGPTPVFTRGSTGTFVGSNKLIQSAAINLPRFDHDPITGICKGLLIEESRTNLVERSEAFNDAYWSKAGVIATPPVVTADQVNSPSGVQSADRIVFPAVAGTNAYSLVFREFTQAAGVSTTQSIYLRGLVGGEKIWIMWTPNGITYVRKECVLTTSWQRFDLNYTSASGLNYFQFGVDLRDASQSTQLAQTIFAWGAQVEAGAFPTSYIPTTSGTAIRSADVCSIVGTDFSSFYNQSEGTLFSSASQPIITSSNALVYAVDANSDTNRFNLRHNSSVAISQVGGLTQAIYDLSNPSANTTSKFAFAYKSTDYNAALNGSLASTQITGTVPTVTQISIGSKGHNSTEYLNGHIARIQYFSKRLSNAKLQTLTAP